MSEWNSGELISQILDMTEAEITHLPCPGCGKSLRVAYVFVTQRALVLKCSSCGLQSYTHGVAHEPLWVKACGKTVVTSPNRGD